MKIYHVNDPAFRAYGRVLADYDVRELLEALDAHTPCPEDRTEYVPEEPALQGLPTSKRLALSLFGGAAAQFGWCNGRNTRLNCLEYHRSSEFNLPSGDIVLLLAKQEEVDADYRLDSARVKAFLVPAGTLVELYATTLHCAAVEGLPRGGYPSERNQCRDDGAGGKLEGGWLSHGGQQVAPRAPGVRGGEARRAHRAVWRKYRYPGGYRGLTAGRTGWRS